MIVATTVAVAAVHVMIDNATIPNAFSLKLHKVHLIIVFVSHANDDATTSMRAIFYTDERQYTITTEREQENDNKIGLIRFQFQ